MTGAACEFGAGRDSAWIGSQRSDLPVRKNHPIQAWSDLRFTERLPGSAQHPLIAMRLRWTGAQLRLALTNWWPALIGPPPTCLSKNSWY